MVFLICVLIRCTKADSIKVSNLFQFSCCLSCLGVNLLTATASIAARRLTLIIQAIVGRRSICQSNHILKVNRSHCWVIKSILSLS